MSTARPDPSTDVDPHVVAAIALVAQAFELSFELDELDDPGDLGILQDQVECAGHHLAEALWSLHPKWRDLDRRAAEREALSLFRDHRPEFDETLRGRGVVLDLLRSAAERTRAGVRGARRYRRERRYWDVASELEYTREHVENVLYLLDPEGFLADVDASTPEQRVMLASRIEVIELDLDENRRIVREGRRLLCLGPSQAASAPDLQS